MKIVGLLAGLVAGGLIGYFVGTETGSSAASPGTRGLAARLQKPGAAVNGADFGFTGSCGVERHEVKDLLDGFVPGAAVDSSVSQLQG
jgi:hypothetical protein